MHHIFRLSHSHLVCFFCCCFVLRTQKQRKWFHARLANSRWRHPWAIHFLSFFFFVGTCFRLAFYYFATSCNRVRRHFIHLLFTHFSRESCHYNGTKSPISLRKFNFLWEFDAVVSALSLLSFHRVHLALPFYLTGRSSSSGSMAFHLVLVHVHIVWTPSPKETVVKRGPW